MAQFQPLSDDLEGGEQPYKDLTDVFLKDAAEEARTGFVQKVFTLLGLQLGVTFAIALPLSLAGPAWAASHEWLFLFSSVLSFVVVLAGVCMPGLMRSFPTNYIYLAVFTALESIVVGFVCAAYTTQSVVLCALMTAGVVLLLGGYAATTKRDFTVLSYTMLAVLGCFCMFMFVLAFFPQTPLLHKAAAAVGALIFSVWIVIDIQQILGGNHKVKFLMDDYVLAAMTIYLDVINLFIFLLELFGDRR